jgi:hypothetical protein
MRRAAGALLAAGAATLALLGAPDAAASSRYCDARGVRSATEQDRLLRVAAVLRRTLEASGARSALVSRSGLNLRWFDQRYSHTGLSLKANPTSPWAVRQLYYACDDSVPKLFDEGLSAFVFGTEDAALGFVSVVTLPESANGRIEPLALDNPSALALLHPQYSANAYAFGLEFQNCNQWLAELLGLALAEDTPAVPTRERAQARLRGLGYSGTVFDLGWSGFTWLTVFSPFLHRQGHPAEDLAAGRFVVSMPASLEAMLRQQVPGAQRFELCHTERHVVVRHGWQAVLAADCTPGEGDEVVALD